MRNKVLNLGVLKMKLYAPNYYKQFNCIADKCTHSCCVGWEIDIDDRTAEKYAVLSSSYGEYIRKSIAYDGTRHFCLLDSQKCPHLNAQGLCNVILNAGEDYLCDICREHPRFYNKTSHGVEVGIGMSCEESCRIILSSDEYLNFSHIGEVDGECDTTFDAVSLRGEIYEIISHASLSYGEILSKIQSKFEISPSELSDSEWNDVLTSLDYLDEKNRERFSAYSSASAKEAAPDSVLKRALAYFIFRHCSPAQNESEFKAALGLSLFLERLIASVSRAEAARSIPEIIEIARTVSEEIEYCEENTDSIKLEFLF